jgi:hypothetical protein
LRFLDEYFTPLVVAGKLISAKINDVGGEGDCRLESKVLYALPHEGWRIDAYRLMDMTSQSVRWNDTLERILGSLLGYSKEENDLWLDYRTRTGRRWGVQTFYRLVTSVEAERIREAGHKAFPVSEYDPIRFYLPRQDEGESTTALAGSYQMTLTRFYAPVIKLMEFSKGITKVSDVSFEIFELPSSGLSRFNELIEGSIDIL